MMMIDTNIEPASALIDNFGDDDDCDDDVILISAAEILSGGRSGPTNHSRLLPGLTLFDSAQLDWTVSPAAAQAGHASVAFGQSATPDVRMQINLQADQSFQAQQLSQDQSSAYTFDSALAVLEADLTHILGGSAAARTLQRSHSDGP